MLKGEFSHGLNTDQTRVGVEEAFEIDLIRKAIMHLIDQETKSEIIGASFEVYRVLGYGFLEKVYQRAMHVELRNRGLKSEVEAEICVVYKGVEVGNFRADLFVENRVIVELKVAEASEIDDEPQLLNELKATGVKVGLLINFGRIKVEFKRLVF